MSCESRKRRKARRAGLQPAVGTASAEATRDYLAQLQERVPPTILRNLGDRLLETLQALGLEEERRGLKAFAHGLREQVPGLPDQDRASYDILRPLLDRTIEAARQLGVREPPIVEIGTLMGDDANAEARGAYGAGHVIAVNYPLLVLSLLVAKSVTYSAYEVSESACRLADGKDPSQVDFGAQQLASLALSLRDHSNPAAAVPSITKVGPATVAMNAYIAGIEGFLVAHEYAHILHSARVAPFPVRLFPGTPSHAEEYAADASGWLLTMIGAQPGDPSPLLAPVALLKCMSIFERDGYVPPTRTHPPYDDRIGSIKTVSEKFFISAKHEKEGVQLLKLSSRLEASLERAWTLAGERGYLNPRPA